MRDCRRKLVLGAKTFAAGYLFTWSHSKEAARQDVTTTTKTFSITAYQKKAPEYDRQASNPWKKKKKKKKKLPDPL